MGNCTEKTRILSTPTIRRYAEVAGCSGSSAVMATAIALAESGGNQFAKDCDSNGTIDYGLWQINSVHGYDPTRLLDDPEYNAKAMYAISNGGKSWSPWVTYNEGKERAYLGQASAATGGVIEKTPVGYESGAEAAKKLREEGTGLTNPFGQAKRALEEAKNLTGATGSLLPGSVGKFFELFTTKQGMIRVAEIVGGGLLLFIAVDELFHLNAGEKIQTIVVPTTRELANSPKQLKRSFGE